MISKENSASRGIYELLRLKFGLKEKTPEEIKRESAQEREAAKNVIPLIDSKLIAFSLQNSLIQEWDIGYLIVYMRMTSDPEIGINTNSLLDKNINLAALYQELLKPVSPMFWTEIFWGLGDIPERERLMEAFSSKTPEELGLKFGLTNTNFAISLIMNGSAAALGREFSLTLTERGKALNYSESAIQMGEYFQTPASTPEELLKRLSFMYGGDKNLDAFSLTYKAKGFENPMGKCGAIGFTAVLYDEYGRQLRGNQEYRDHFLKAVTRSN